MAYASAIRYSNKQTAGRKAVRPSREKAADCARAPIANHVVMEKLSLTSCSACQYRRSYTKDRRPYKPKVISVVRARRARSFGVHID
jgi:hypothetical protein